jgi:hypothetical protein
MKIYFKKIDDSKWHTLGFSDRDHAIQYINEIALRENITFLDLSRWVGQEISIGSYVIRGDDE